ncbi:hypothetical protein NX722_02425 [Endozoicomonas gorgoniicola]|uniref:Uncharacterized protein n=1 Tax=Endozoicomonas gorgoniicola TaxID=1234144 RepID=A0ABT3MQ65_9GAMM|nr:hypothetical protein [Endozoicomonas gorgoniicola]MCW7551516.1 hypothetical protein [Endozoicomonas gorgoniicola]
MKKEQFTELVSGHAMDGLSLAALVVDQLTGTSIGTMVGSGIENIAEAAGGSEPARTPNPLFIAQGHDFDGFSELVRQYFVNRKLKKIGGGFLSAVGNVGSLVTQVNTTGIARHARAETKTIAHIARLKQLSSRFSQSEYLTQLCAVLLKMKELKVISRGGQLAADCIPISIASGVIGAASGIGGNIVANRYGSLVLHTSILLHWRAFQESQLSSTFGGSGPATEMVHELFGQTLRRDTPDWSTVDGYIRDPAGWAVIQDKINLI